MVKGGHQSERSKELNRIKHLGNKNRLGKRHSIATKEILSGIFKGVPNEKNLGKLNGMWRGGLKEKIKRDAEKRKAHFESLAGRPVPSKCEICDTERSKLKNSFHFDHDHKTGKFRGWICGRCNTALGMVNDDIKVLNKLIEYLKKNS